MRKIFFITCMIFAALPATGFAQDAAQSSYNAPTGRVDNVTKTNDLGVGLEIGTMTGPQIKWWASENSAVDVGVGFNGPNTAVTADYLWHFRNAVQNATGNEVFSQLTPYIGIGAVAAFGGNQNIFNRDTGNFGMGARVPVGLEYLPRSVPVGVFAEAQPGIGFTPNTFGFLQADLGGRYYF